MCDRKRCALEFTIGKAHPSTHHLRRLWAPARHVTYVLRQKWPLRYVESIAAGRSSGQASGGGDNESAQGRKRSRRRRKPRSEGAPKTSQES